MKKSSPQALTKRSNANFIKRVVAKRVKPALSPMISHLKSTIPFAGSFWEVLVQKKTVFFRMKSLNFHADTIMFSITANQEPFASNFNDLNLKIS